MSRKKADFDWKQFDSYLHCKMSKIACATLMGVSYKTIENRVREKYDMTFTEYAQTQLSHTQLKLVNKAISLALEGNVTMLIFCLKNLCHWSDKQEDSAEPNKTFTLNYNIKDGANGSEDDKKTIAV